MTNFQKRLILTLVSIPTVFTLIFWPERTHLPGILLFGVLVTFFGSFEIGKLILQKGIIVRRYFISIINVLILIFAYCYANNILNINSYRITFVLFFSFIIAVISYVFARDVFKKDLEKSFEKMAYTLFGIVYIGVPSFIMPFILNFKIRPENPVPGFFSIESHGTLTGSFLCLYLILLIWSSDIFAYVFGMAFGRSSIIGLTASPNKSWAGYIGGYFSTFFFSGLFYLIFDKIFGFISFPIWFYLVLPVFSGFIVPIGDLVESVFKRSIHVKDSGEGVPGRGGVLDSVDTILYFVPVFFIVLQLYSAIFVN